MSTLDQQYSRAVALLGELKTPHGFLASTLDQDNYKRIWARDSMVCGIAALDTLNEDLIEGFRDSLITLANYQDFSGMIPSNVDPISGDVSFGSLVGRIDANTWFIIGACVYYLRTQDASTWKKLKKKVLKTRQYLIHLEFNNKGWLYTPLSGNWADEYPVHGYTLYDNSLRILAEELLTRLGHGINFDINLKTYGNFWPVADPRADIYHNAGYQEAIAKGVQNFAAFILPGHYDLRFDAAGNALAMHIFDLNEDMIAGFENRISGFKSELGSALTPAFWPVIEQNSFDWPLLKNNYSFSFKNKPGDFHNGGVWPVWMGLFATGLAKQGQKELLKEVIFAFETEILKKPDWQFQEYYNPLRRQFGGKSQMGYSAAGVIFTSHASKALSNKFYDSIFHDSQQD